VKDPETQKARVRFWPKQWRGVGVGGWNYIGKVLLLF